MTRVGVAIVTGASRGIGAEIAKRLAKDGYAVVVNYANSKQDAEKVVAEIRQSFGQAVACRADVSSAEEVKELFDNAEQEFGPVNVVVNNAGVGAPKPTNVTEMEDDTFDHLFDVNVRGTFNMCREAARRMGPGGRIVNFSSSMVELGHAGFAAYGASKAAVSAFTRILAQDLRGREINVNSIAPGATETEFFTQGKSPEMQKFYRSGSPHDRLGHPDEIASVVAFLVGPDGRWVNGQNILVNGGAT